MHVFRAPSQPPSRRRRRTGTEPLTAYSDLRLRRLLSAVFAPLFVAGAVGFTVWWVNAGPDDPVGRGPIAFAAVVCGVFAVVALVDLAVVRRRLRDHDQRGGPG